MVFAWIIVFGIFVFACVIARVYRGELRNKLRNRSWTPVSVCRLRNVDGIKGWPLENAVNAPPVLVYNSAGEPTLATGTLITKADRTPPREVYMWNRVTGYGPPMPYQPAPGVFPGTTIDPRL